MFTRLHSFIGLPARERRLALQALGTLVVVRLALWVLPFGRIRTLVDRWARVPRADPDVDAARGVRRAVDRAARSIPNSACLAQAVTAELMLRRAGQAARVTIGVAPNGRLLDAHAWVECAGLLVTGDRSDLVTYRTLAIFGSDARANGAP